MDGWLSGLKHLFTKQTNSKGFRGFESLIIRHFPRPRAGGFFWFRYFFPRVRGKWRMMSAAPPALAELGRATRAGRRAGGVLRRSGVPA